jgi:MSHA biogenesis protein MshJ
MKLRNTVTPLAARFDRLSLRERMLTTAAILAVLIALFNSLVMHGLEMRRKQLAQQLAEIGSAVDGSGNGSDASATLERATTLAASLGLATARLHSESAGLIPPQRMTQVIHDVLSRQQGITLVSLRSLPPYALIDSPSTGDTEAQSPGTDVSAGQTVPAAAASGASEGPYVHSVELVVQGRYLDVLTYLQALEGLSWHFYWQSLALDASQSPTARVTLRLGTLSMSRDWIDL